jgi:hypothetical protein
MRREFHETSMIPLFKLIEFAFYEQVHVREFKSFGWEFKFDSPDFLNAVETATVHMRYVQMGALSPNEVRYELGKSPYDKGNGYVDITGENAISEPQGSPPEGRPVEPDDPSQTGEPTLDYEDPVRGDQHDETSRDSILMELRQWERFASKRVKAGKVVRPFRPIYIPSDLAKILNEHIQDVDDVITLHEYFTIASEVVNDYK